jgi:hypothetical protein
MMQQPFTFKLPDPVAGALKGYSTSDDRMYRWAQWDFHNTGRPYINFICLHPRAAADPIQEEWIDRHMCLWERGADRAGWRCGGYVVTAIFPRVVWNVGAMRRLHQQGVDLVGSRGVDASMAFAKNASMLVMLPGLDDALDVRPEHQSLVLAALTGVGVPISTVNEVGMPEEWKP